MVSSSAVYPENTVRPFKEDSERAANKFWGKYGTDTIPLAEGLRESCEWYLANEAEVNKKPYLKFIDENLVKNFIGYPLR